MSVSVPFGFWKAPPAGGYDTDADLFFTAVGNAGGSISTATKGYVNTFVVAAKNNNYWNKLLRINLFCGDQLTAALVPLKVGGGNPTETNTNFVSGDYTEATGLKGNGSSKRLDTGIVPSTMLTLNDTHSSMYNRSSAGGGSMGCVSGGGTNFIRFLFPDSSNGKGLDDHNNNGNGRLATASALSTPFGFGIGNRSSSTSHDIYRNGTSIASNATQSGGLPNNNFYVFESNGDGTPGIFTDDYIAAYSIGSGLSSTDASNYNTDMQAFQTSMGRNV